MYPSVHKSLQGPRTRQDSKSTRDFKKAGYGAARPLGGAMGACRAWVNPTVSSRTYGRLERRRNRLRDTLRAFVVTGGQDATTAHRIAAIGVPAAPREPHMRGRDCRILMPAGQRAIAHRRPPLPRIPARPLERKEGPADALCRNRSQETWRAETGTVITRARDSGPARAGMPFGQSGSTGRRPP
jgi:hypothetical protein